jgi:hypothetical protein
MSTQDLWAALSTQPFPHLHELAPEDRDGFVLLDAYLRDCLEEWCISGGQLSARSIVLLDDYAGSITRRFRLLDGEGQYYFGQLRRLALRILRGLDVEQAHPFPVQADDAELDWGECFRRPCCRFQTGSGSGSRKRVISRLIGNSPVDFV